MPYYYYFLPPQQRLGLLGAPHSSKRALCDVEWIEHLITSL